MFQTAKFFTALAATGLYALPALAHPGHGPESAIPGHIHSSGELGLLLGAVAGTAVVLFIVSRLIGAVRQTKT